jgi:hypothetical protein
MTDTPRTDASEFKRDLEGNPWVKSDFGRELERELTAAIKQRDEARREVCFAYGPMAEVLAAARRRGWDCFDAPHATDGRVQNGGA